MGTIGWHCIHLQENHDGLNLIDLYFGGLKIKSVFTLHFNLTLRFFYKFPDLYSEPTIEKCKVS